MQLLPQTWQRCLDLLRQCSVPQLFEWARRRETVMHGRQRGLYVAIAAIAAVSAGLISYYSFRPRHVAAELDTPGNAGFDPADQLKLLKSAPCIDPVQIAAITRSIATAIEAPSAEPSRFTAEMRIQLEKTLLEHIQAFTQTTPDEYLRLLERTGARWIPRDAPEWRPIDYACEQLLRRQADRANPQVELVFLLQEFRFKDAERFLQVASGDRGMKVLTQFARTSGELDLSLIAERYGVKEHDLWNKGGRHGIRLSVPRVAAAETIRKHGGAMFAQSAIQFRIVNDRPVIWHATWFWDPSTNSWLNHNMAVESYNGAALFY